jgi:hypothetical protein
MPWFAEQDVCLGASFLVYGGERAYKLMFGGHPLMRLALAFNTVLKVATFSRQLSQHAEYTERTAQAAAARIEGYHFTDVIEMTGLVLRRIAHARFLFVASDCIVPADLLYVARPFPPFPE